MPGIIRITDLCSGHDGYHRVQNVSASPNTFTNMIPVVRYGDSRGVHSCYGLSHSAVNLGLHNVIVNSRSIQTGSDPTSCGSIQDQCSRNTYVN